MSLFIPSLEKQTVKIIYLSIIILFEYITTVAVLLVVVVV